MGRPDLPVRDPRAVLVVYLCLQLFRPSDPSIMVRLVVCASFEFAPMLGRGEPLRTLETSVGALLDRTDCKD